MENQTIKTQENFLEDCLFFNVNSLSRQLLKLAEKEFKPLAISPAHASLLLLVFDRPGISPKELSAHLNLTPSTITRFIDALEKKGLVIREARGKAAFITPSKKGLELKAPVASAYKRLYLTYTQILGPGPTRKLSVDILTAAKKLADHFETDG